ncbi:MAG: hypothetical protein ACJ748_08850 [Flavisolibacter sp.]
MEYTSLSTEQIASLFEKADQELKQALLEGAEWKEISDKRFRYTELSIELHKRKKPEDFGYSPADTAIRKH